MSTAFSFSKQKKTSSFVKFDKDVPNVGKYNVTQITFNSRIKTSPSISLGKASRCKLQTKIVPGPGAYDVVNKVTFNSNKGTTLKGTHDIKIKAEGPQPGHYNPLKQFPSKQYSFSKSVERLSKKQGPDPGTYDVKYQVLNSTSNYIFDKAQRQTFPKKSWTKNIGPGCHQINENLLLENANKYSFPKKQKFKQQTIEIQQKSLIPGPGKYDLSKARQNMKSAKFSTASKSIHIKQQVPGPGSYQVPSPKNSQSGVVVGKQPRQHKYNSLAPGPGSYNVEKQAILLLKNKNSFNIIFPKESRLKTPTNKINIGPGQYDLDDCLSLSSVKQKNKGYSIKGRAHLQKIQNIPGPQAYNPDYKKVCSNGQRAIIGKQKRLPLKKNQIPGPGAYQSQDKKQFSKTFYFSRSQAKSLQGKGSTSNVGPGQYKLKPYFGEFSGKDKLNLKSRTLYV